MRPRHRSRAVALVASVAALALAACEPQPVDWDAARPMPFPPLGHVTRLDVSGGMVVDTVGDRADSMGPPDAARCAGSTRVAEAGGILYAVWWSVRPDSGAVLRASRSPDAGRTWSAAVPVDTVDRGASGCRRTAPDVAADAASGYVHVVYGLEAPEGPGLFYAHSMDRGASFHSPVPILYGEKLGRIRVAADGDHVAVAFEDPNASEGRIGLALSATMGHIFESRLSVSDDHAAASHPAVAVRGVRLAVAWRQGADDGARPAAAVVRTGRLRSSR